MSLKTAQSRHGSPQGGRRGGTSTGCSNFSVPQACWSLPDAVEASASGISPRIPFLLGPRARRLPSVRPNGGGRSTHLPRWGSRIINRPRTEELFKFHFRMEIYVPKGQRQFGYFVMPILHGDRLIGRIDPVFDRERRQLRLNRIFAEADAPKDSIHRRSDCRSRREPCRVPRRPGYRLPFRCSFRLEGGHVLTHRRARG